MSEEVVYVTEAQRKLREFRFDNRKQIRASAEDFLHVLRAARAEGWTSPETKARLSFQLAPSFVLQVQPYGWVLKRWNAALDQGEWAVTLADPESFVSALAAWCGP
jgi:hypothetical protein